MAAPKQSPENYYDGLISAYERSFQAWEKRASEIVRRFRDEQRARKDSDVTKFNILWSNVNTLVPACYSKLPQPDVGRRFNDPDPIGRVASLILERALSFEIEHYPDYRATMRESVLDRFLPGRGQAWARYEPHFKAGESQLPSDGLQITEDQDEPDEQIDYECAPVDYVHWRDFGHNVARTWEEVFVVWRVVYMYEEGVEERFGKKIAGKLAYDATPEDKRKELPQQEVKKQARIYEIWDKQKKKVCWFSRSKKEMLDERDDPLGLQEFFPCPRPLYATMSNDTLVPVPDFALYQDQARELDTLADRIDGLVKMLQVKGCYDASIPELSRLFTEGVNGTLIPVKNFAAFAEKKGLQGSIDIVDLKPIYEAIKVCFESAREIINFIYQITGISDIVRGQTEAGETLGAQQLKVNFVGLRLGDMKRDVARYATDLLQLKAQILCQHFSPQTIMSMAACEQLSPQDQQYAYEFEPPKPPQMGPDGKPLPPPPPQPKMGPDGKPLPGLAMALLIGKERMQDPEADSPNPMRSFRIEVNADTLVQLDEQAEKDAAKDYLATMAKFMEIAQQVAAGAPPLIQAMMDMVKWVGQKYKVGKNFEGVLDQAIEEMKKLAQQPKPNPDMVKIEADTKMKQAQLQHDQQKAQMESQFEIQKHQAEMQLEQTKIASEAQSKREQAQIQAQVDQHRATLEIQRDQFVKQAELDFKRWEVEKEAETKIAVAEITAKATLDAAQLKAAQSEARD